MALEVVLPIAYVYLQIIPTWFHPPHMMLVWNQIYEKRLFRVRLFSDKHVQGEYVSTFLDVPQAEYADRNVIPPEQVSEEQSESAIVDIDGAAFCIM